MSAKGASARNRSISAMPAAWVLLISLLLAIDHSTEFVECVHVPESSVPSIHKELLPAAAFSPQFYDVPRVSFKEGKWGINRRVLHKQPPISYPPLPHVPAAHTPPSHHPPPPPPCERHEERIKQHNL